MSALSLVDSPLFGGSFVDAGMRELFSSDAFIGRCFEAEVALARSQARLGIIPQAAALEIAAAAETHVFDEDRLRSETEVVGYPVLPIVEQLADAAGEGGRYLHWGLGRPHTTSCTPPVDARSTRTNPCSMRSRECTRSHLRWDWGGYGS